MRRLCGMGQMDQDRRVVGTFLSRRADLLEYAASRVGSDLAEEVVQDAFIRISTIRLDDPRWTTGPRGEIRDLHAYIFGIVRNLAIDRIRSRSLERQRYAPVEQLDLQPGGVSPEQAAMERQQLDLIAQALKELPPRTRAAFTMQKVQGLRLREIADILDISVARVDQLVRNAMRHLAQQLPDLTQSDNKLSD